MKTAVLFLAFLLSLGSALAAGPGQLVDYDEARHQNVLAESKGQVVLFNFWATWCAPCRTEMPLLVALNEELSAKGFRMVTVSADDTEDRAQALEFLQENDVPAPAYIKSVDDDDAFIESIQPEWSGALPALFLYDRGGKLAKMWVGETEMSEIRSAIAGLL